MPLMKVLANMELEGISLDKKWLEQEEYTGADLEQAEKAQAVRQLAKLSKYETVREALASGKLELCALYFRLDPISMETYEDGEWRAL